MADSISPHQSARKDLQKWKEALKENFYEKDSSFHHSLKMMIPDQFEDLNSSLSGYGKIVFEKLEKLVNENDLFINNPRLESYNEIGQKDQKVIHHPLYNQTGEIIYKSGMMKKMSMPGGLLPALSYFYLSSHTGEAGHHCPIACSAGIIRVLQKVPDFPKKDFFLKKLTEPSFETNFTGAQFLTEIQGGSDVGKNATLATKDEKDAWRIHGEKWFCSNANAELILLTARYNENVTGTKGLGLFLIPQKLENGKNNSYTLRQLKNKIGTRAMASAEIDFEGALAWPIGKIEDGFPIVMENVLHISRIFNTFTCLGMGKRAFQIASLYAQNRRAFGKSIDQYPLIQETLADMKVEHLALMSFIIKATSLQDKYDSDSNPSEENKLLLRILVNLNKYISSLWSVEHIHRAIDVLGGNGAIETFSPLPRLLRDSIVCENWEGTHNTLRMQILRDIERYKIDSLFVSYLEKEIEKLSKGYQKSFREYLLVLKNDLSWFKNQTPYDKSFFIKEITNHLSFLGMAITLGLEATHQKETGKGGLKEKALDFFTNKYLRKREKLTEKGDHIRPADFQDITRVT